MPEYFIGLMSGTSMDAIDAALVDFQGCIPQLCATHSLVLPDDLRDELNTLTTPGYDELDRAGQLDVRLGRLFGDAALHVVRRAGLTPADITAIGSHGQTIRHRPGGDAPFSWQIGDPNVIAEHTGIATVADFRRRDMAAGGQGAPLVPAFHSTLFRVAGEDRAVLNIGGIANLTLLPGTEDRPVTGFDTGPGNTLLDAWARRHLGTICDQGGEWGAGGREQASLLDSMLRDEYFAGSPPKSTGREYFHLRWLEDHLGEDLREAAAARDVQATLQSLTVRTITDALGRFLPRAQRVLVCGGGVHNTALMQKLTESLAPIAVSSTTPYGLDPDWVEAAAFAWLARRTLCRKAGNLPDVTGASHPVVLGAIYAP